MGVARKLIPAIFGWLVGAFASLAGSVLVAWALNAWLVFRRGIGIGFAALAIAFWGLVIGLFIVGPIVAVHAVRGLKVLAPRPDLTTRLESATVADAARVGGTRRVSLSLALVLGVGAATVAGGAGWICFGLGRGPCRGLPPHEAVGRGDFRYVLPSPDGSRYAFVSAYGDDTYVGLLEPGAAADVNAGLPTLERLGIVPKDIAWMPGQERLLMVFRERTTPTPDRIGIFSLESGSMERAFELPFQAADLGGIAVSADGASALVTSEPWIHPGETLYSGDLYRVDLAMGRVEEIEAEFVGWPEFPLYLDDRHAVVMDYFYGHSRLSLVDLESASVEVLTPSDLNVYGLAGRGAGGEILFFAYHSSTDLSRTSLADFDDPVVALVEPGGEVHELFDPGVLHTMRMYADGVRAVAIADTCLGDCSGEEVWTLDLSRYLDSD